MYARIRTGIGRTRRKTTSTISRRIALGVRIPPLPFPILFKLFPIVFSILPPYLSSLLPSLHTRCIPAYPSSIECRSTFKVATAPGRSPHEGLVEYVCEKTRKPARSRLEQAGSSWLEPASNRLRAGFFWKILTAFSDKCALRALNWWKKVHCGQGSQQVSTSLNVRRRRRRSSGHCCLL